MMVAEVVSASQNRRRRVIESSSLSPITSAAELRKRPDSSSSSTIHITANPEALLLKHQHQDCTSINSSSNSSSTSSFQEDDHILMEMKQQRSSIKSKESSLRTFLGDSLSDSSFRFSESVPELSETEAGCYGDEDTVMYLPSKQIATTGDFTKEKKLNSYEDYDGDKEDRVEAAAGTHLQAVERRASHLPGPNAALETANGCKHDISLERVRWSSSGRSDDSGIIHGNATESTKTVRRRNTQRESASSDNGDDNDDGSSYYSCIENQPILSELRTVPDDKYWNSPVSWKRPRTILRKVRLMAGRVVEHAKVQIIIIILIVINALMMGIATFDFVTDHGPTDAAFRIVDTVFLSIFTVELALQMCYRGVSLFFDAWLVFDFVIICASWSLESLQIIRAFRIFRAVRLITRIGPLRELIKAIGAVMPRMYAITLLLLLFFYIFAVLFTILFGDLELSQNYFTSLDNSLFTCMELMTMQWSDITREVMTQKSWAWMPFLSYIAITGFIVFNLIVAVVCDAVAVIDREVKAERDGPVETDASKLKEAQELIYELSGQVEVMKEQHIKMCQAMGFLTGELQRSLSMMEQFYLEPESSSLRNKTDLDEDQAALLDVTLALQRSESNDGDDGDVNTPRTTMMTTKPESVRNHDDDGVSNPTQGSIPSVDFNPPSAY